LDAANHSRLALDAVMTHRILNDKDIEEIIEDLRRYLNRASDNLDAIEKEGEISCYTRYLTWNYTWLISCSPGLKDT